MASREWTKHRRLLFLALLFCGFFIVSGVYALLKEDGKMGQSVMDQTALIMAGTDQEKTGEKAQIAIKVEQEALSLVAVGDVMLGRKIDDVMRTKGMGYPFLKTAPLLGQADIAFANLETPLFNQGNPSPEKEILFRGQPEYAQALSQAGFDVVSLANNHALDYGIRALSQTMTLLHGSGISTVGGGKNTDEARQPVIINEKGMSIAFLAYCKIEDITELHQQISKTKGEQGIPGIAPLIMEEIKKDIQKAKEKADIVIISLHWGGEYQDHPKNEQREIAHQLIDAGANVILGHHPHTIQGLEWYQGGLIAYSLGNFVFDQNQNARTQEGLLLHLKMQEAALRQAEVFPIYINQGQPEVAEGEKGAGIMKRTAYLSEQLGTQVRIKDGKGLIMPGDS